jgi:hypothetical protein
MDEWTPVLALPNLDMRGTSHHIQRTPPWHEWLAVHSVTSFEEMSFLLALSIWSTFNEPST